MPTALAIDDGRKAEGPAPGAEPDVPSVEVEVDLAVYALGRAVADLVAAAESHAARAYVAANRERLGEDLARLSRAFAALEPSPARSPGAASEADLRDEFRVEISFDRLGAALAAVA